MQFTTEYVEANRTGVIGLAVITLAALQLHVLPPRPRLKLPLDVIRRSHLDLSYGYSSSELCPQIDDGYQIGLCLRACRQVIVGPAREHDHPVPILTGG